MSVEDLNTVLLDHGRICCTDYFLLNVLMEDVFFKMEVLNKVSIISVLKCNILNHLSK